jgi:hypothetical protein
MAIQLLWSVEQMPQQRLSILLKPGAEKLAAPQVPCAARLLGA